MQSESEFAALVDALAADRERRDRLTDLLREDDPIYDQRGAAAIARMRGWVLLALARAGLSDGALPYVLEELDAGANPYLIAAAARTLRAYPTPLPFFAPFVMRAIENVRYFDEPVCLDKYGEYALSDTGCSPVRELLATLTWLGPQARGVRREVECLLARPGGLSPKFLSHVGQALEAINRNDLVARVDSDCCTSPGGLSSFSWRPGLRRSCEKIESTLFEDQNRASIKFKEFFDGHASIVVFFYTRCDNPLKCSLTVTKLGRVQRLLEERGVADQIHTAAITYDPAFDLPDRMRGYGQNRRFRMNDCHRMLRTVGNVDGLRNHFRLGVNFVESLVNRHRIELYILDAKGRIAASFERLHWDEAEVVDRAIEVLNEPAEHSAAKSRIQNHLAQIPGLFAALAVAFFPKCPICWAAYLSVFGIASLEHIPYSPWLQPLLIIVMLINIASVWSRARITQRFAGFYLVSAGALTILISRMGPRWDKAAGWGVALTLAGSLLSAMTRARSYRRADQSLLT